jgi:hypothetical protein
MAQPQRSRSRPRWHAGVLHECFNHAHSQCSPMQHLSPPVDGQQVARSCCYTSQRAGHAASKRDRRRTPCSAMQQRNASNGRAAQAPPPYIGVGVVHLGPPVQQQARHVQVAVQTRPIKGCASILQVQQGATYAALTTSSPQQVQPKDAHEQSHTMQSCSRRWMRPASDAWGYKV